MKTTFIVIPKYIIYKLKIATFFTPLILQTLQITEAYSSSIPNEISCGVSLINENKTCTFSIPQGNYTLSITQPYNVFSQPQYNGGNISFYFKPTSAQIFFAVMQVKNNSTSEEKSVFLKGEGFSWEKIKINSKTNIGKVFVGDNPTIYFDIENLSELGVVYINSNYSCQLTYILPKDKITCSTKLDYGQEKKSDFSKVFDINLKVDNYQGTITFYVYGKWASPKIIIEGSPQFDGVLVGRSETKFIKISNKGDYPLIISETLVSPPFYVGNIPSSIDDVFFLPITFIPTSVSQFSQKITIITNIGYIEIAVSGTSVMNPLPTLFSERITTDFGTLIKGEKKTEFINISNTGAENLVIRNIYIPPNNAFFIDGNMNFPIFIQPSKNFTIPIAFNPQVEGEFESYADIESNDPEKLKFRINLYGRANIPDVSATTSIDFGYIRVGIKKRKDIIISNEKFFPFMISNINCDEKDRFTFEKITTPKILKYQETISIPVIFSPNEIKKYESECIITTILPISSSDYSFERGENVTTKSLRISISGYGGYPYISVKDKIDFGEIWSDESKEIIFPIENTGDTELEVKILTGSEKFKLSTHETSVRPKESFPLKIIFSPEGTTGDFSSYLKLFSNDPLFPEKNIKITAISKSPKVVFEGKGCNSFKSIFVIAALIYLFYIIKRLSLISAIFFLIIFGRETFSMNMIFTPKSWNRFFFTSEPKFYAKGTISLSDVIYFSYGQLQKNIYKDQNLVRSENLIKGSIISEISTSYSLSEKNIVYTSLPFIYAFGEIKGFGVADPFFGWKTMIYEFGEFIFSSDVFASIPIGSKRMYLQNSPFSAGLIGAFKINEFNSNAGVIYGGKEIPIRALITTALSFRLTKNIFNGYEGYIIFPINARMGFTSSEISTSLGLDLEEITGKIGLSKGVIGGFGSAGLRIFFSATANINPKSNPSVKYFESSGIITDGLGNRIKNCKIQVKKIMLSEHSIDGEFRIRLPEGTHELEILCEGFEINKTYVSNINPNARIIMEKIEPTLIAYSTDKTGIPLERNIKVTIDENEFEVETYYIVLRGQKNIKIESENISKHIMINEPEFLWMRLEENKENVETAKQANEEKEKNMEDKETKASEGLKENDVEVSVKESQSEMRDKPIQKNLEKLSSTIQGKVQEKFYDIYTGKEGEVIFRFVISGFPLNSASIPMQGQKNIQEVVDFMTRNISKISEVLIEGHTDDTGSESWNMELSYLRANSIRKYLFEKGLTIPMKIVGYGLMFPVKRTDNPNAKAINRRVEIKVIMK